MELRHFQTNGKKTSFSFSEDNATHDIVTPNDLTFGYKAYRPDLLLNTSVVETDDKLPEGDIALTFIGRERSLLAASQILLHIADEAEVPLHIVMEERFKQRILTVFTNTWFTDAETLEGELLHLIREVDAQLPAPYKPEFETEDETSFVDPLDQIGVDDALSIYIEEDESDTETEEVTGT